MASYQLVQPDKDKMMGEQLLTASQKVPRFGYRRMAAWLCLSDARVRRMWRTLGLKTREAAKAEQLAWFVYVSKITLGPDQASVAYQTPYNGKYGTATFSKTDGQWTVQDHQRMHSSSGARNFYGELYEGTDCRDGSEMAKRWNTYKDAVEAAMARRPRSAESALPSTCPGKEFPDVAAYKQFKAMGLNK